MDKAVRSMNMDILGRQAVGKNRYRVTIAANEKVRQPPDLDFDGLSIENYQRNPVVMWAHDAVGRSPSGGLPIGRTLNLNRTPEGRMVADFEFLADDPFAQRVKNAWDKGFLQAASISWVPVESVPSGNGQWRDTRSDLLEWSIVSVPADPDALRATHLRMLDSLLGVGGQSQGARDGLSGSVDEPGQSEAMELSPDDYEDLTIALSLLREVVDGVEQASRMPRTSLDTEAEDEGDDIRELREMVGAIRGSMEDLTFSATA